MTNPTWKHLPENIVRHVDTGRLTVFVLRTQPDLLKGAVRQARELSRDLRARVLVMAAQVVPYPRDVNDPPVSPEFAAERLREETGLVEDLVLLLCRDPQQAFLEVLPQGALVVMGARKRLWKTAEDVLAKRLRTAGHEVVMVYA